jgi:excisionase family DNA binding protein
MTTHLATEDAATDRHPFLTATEVGQQLGLGKSRVYALAAEGLLPTVRLGRRIWFPRRGLEALAEAAIERAEGRIARSAQLIH